jgi:ketosteroid isomerase-like protein
MSAQQNVELIEELYQARRDGDFDRFGALVADDAVFRMAGVPAGLGGVTSGRQAIVDQVRATAGGSKFQIKQLFGDDKNVCVVGKATAEGWPGNEVLRGASRPYSTYECVLYRIADGKVVESTTYLNWLDVYVQVGLVDLATLTN